MKKFMIKISFISKPPREIIAESNDNITAMNMVLNKLESSERNNVIGVKLFTYSS